jgi:outer membrane protein assembly factor BamB
MKQLLKRLLLLCLIMPMFAACSKSDKPIDLSKYEDLESGTMKSFVPDPALKSQPVRLPNATKTTMWASSGDILNEVPQNILAKSSGGGSYNVHDRFSKDYHFVSNSPVIYGNKLFVLGNSSSLHAYNLSNLNEELWEKSLGNTEEDAFRGGGIFASNNYLAVTHGSNDVILLNAGTGVEKWKYMMSNISRAAPVIYKGMVFVLTVDNKLYCLDLATGLLKWVNEGAAEQLGVIKAASIIAYENIVLVPYSVGQVYAINIADGKQLWNLSMDDKFSSIGDLFTPVISNNVAYLSSFKGALYALNLKTGNVVWTNHYAGGNEIWIAGDYIFCMNKNSQLSAVNKLTGKVKWIQDLPNDSFYTSPIIINSELFVASSSGSLLTFSPFTGKQIRSQEIAAGRYSDPIATSAGLFLLSEKGKLLVF